MTTQRIVLAIEEMPDGSVGRVPSIRVEESPRAADYLSGRFDLAPPAGSTPRDRGTELYTRLRDHPPVCTELDAAFGAVATAPTEALYFHIRHPNAHALSWEELYVNGDFCTLNPRWPVGRMARETTPSALRTLNGRLNIVAVLSAAGRSGLAQARSLLSLVHSTVGEQLGVHLTIISAEDAVLAAARAADPAGVTTIEMPIDGTALLAAIKAAEPHILHIFGHGSAPGADSGMPLGDMRTLVFASAADFLATGTADDTATGSISLHLSHLVRAVQGVNPLLVFLAACETAGAAGGPVLAHEVALGAVPAVIGMRRLVDVRTVNSATATLYPAVLDSINAALATVDGRLDWASVLSGTRAALAGDPNSDSWADPVLYLGSRDFVVRSTADNTDTVSYLGLLGERNDLSVYLNANTIEAGLRLRISARIAELDAAIAAHFAGLGMPVPPPTLAPQTGARQ